MLPLLIVLLPFSAFVIQILLGRRLPRQGDWISTGAILLSLLLILLLFAEVMGGSRTSFPEQFPEQGYTWIDLGDWQLNIGIQIDTTTAFVLLMVGVACSMIHLFSIGYMHGDPRYPRFFAYISLFSGSMLGLVLSNNLLTLFVFWELMGVCSYLLIGFWFEKEGVHVKPADAAKKAFMTTRIGDVLLLLGLLILFLNIGDLRFNSLYDGVTAGKLSGTWLTVAGLLILGGAIGKSAQFPLHTWLPDAMEGPTPVSALIHAATMVAAGVYLVARSLPIMTPSVLLTVAYVGGFTAIFAASIALVRRDIKSVLAYSTISQLGYMMLGLGAGSYVAGVLHLTTHGFFKALLFLGSGSVIHAVHTQDMFEMGGLRKKMPWTFWTFLIATCSIAGVPLFSGFFSKDKILATVLARAMENTAFWPLAIVGFIAAGMTAFYMFRLLFLTFFGEARDKEKYDHAHESPRTMVIALVVLALLSSPLVYPLIRQFEHDVPEPVSAIHATVTHEASVAHEATPHASGDEADHSAHGAAHTWAMVLSIIIAATGILLAAMFYYWKRFSPEQAGARFASFYRLLWNKYYFDELYDAVFVRPSLALARVSGSFDLGVIDGLVNAIGAVGRSTGALSGWIDNTIVDGLVNLVGDTTRSAGAKLRRTQTGMLQDYLMYVFGGVLLLIVIVVVLF